MSDPIMSGPWPIGIDNRQPDHALPDGALRNAVNVDIDNLGFVRRRAGYTKVSNGLMARAGFSCPAGTFFIDAANLKRLNADNTSDLLYSGIIGAQIGYEYFNGEVYVSDGRVALRIKSSGAVVPWGMIPPVVHGLLPGGATTRAADATRRLYAYTFYDEDGRESGASDLVEAPASIGSTQHHVVGVNQYMSAPGGTTLHLNGDGRMLDKQFLSSPPPGRIIRYANGRMYIADGATLWYSEPYAIDLFRLSANFYQFTADISVVEVVAGGLWVVADKTYFFAGTGPDDYRQIEVLPYGAIFGTGMKLANANGAVWQSTRGTVIGQGDGSAKNIQEPHVSPDTGTHGAAMISEANGVKQYVASVQAPILSPAAAKSFMTMEIVRRST